MQTQGMSDIEISQRLQEQGANPKEIDDAISQSKIKAAVFDNANYEQAGQNSIINNNEMLPSIASQTSQTPSTQEIPQQQEYYYPEQYAQQEYYQPQQQGVASETISEIAEQIVVEKMSEIKKTTSNLLDFKTVIEAKISSIDSRLKKIETTIEKLQSSIIGKVGEYGQAIEDIKNEMYGMEESFSKVINPLVEKGRRASKSEKEVEEVPETRNEILKSREETQTKENNSDSEARESRKKSNDGFEGFLR